MSSAESSFQAQLDKAWAAERAGKFSTAVDLCNDIIYVHPSSADAYLCRSKSNRGLGKLDSAMADCNVAISLNSNHPEYFCNRALIYCAQGDFQSAVKDCTQAIDLNQKFADAYACRSTARHALGEETGALEDCNQAIKLDSKLANAYMTRSAVRAKLGDSKGSAADSKKALRLDPQVASAIGKDEVQHSSKKDPDKCCDGEKTGDISKQLDWGNVSEISESQLPELLRSKTYVVVFIYGTWCKPCVESLPVLRQAASENDGRIKFVRMNSDSNAATCKAYNIKGVPTYLFIANAGEVDRCVGKVKIDLIRKYTDRLLSATAKNDSSTTP